MGFDEVQFPTTISYGSSGGPGFKTIIIELASGAEERNSRYNTPRRRYDVKYGLDDYDDLMTVQEFYIARLGAANGFRFKDWLDFTTASDHIGTATKDNVVIGTGDGSDTTFQLIKKYSNGGQIRNRNIRKPLTGTVLIAIDGVAKTEGVDFSVNTTNGIVTFNVAPALNTQITAGCSFDVPVRFSENTDDLLSVNHQAYQQGSYPSIEVIELLDENPINDELNYGGGDTLSLTTDTSITLLTGKVLNITPDASNHKIILPAPDDMSTGGIHFVLVNASASYTFDLEDEDSNSLGTISVSSNVLCCVVDNAGSNEWVVLT